MVDATNAKALARKCQTLIQIGHFDQARSDITELKARLKEASGLGWTKEEVQMVKEVCASAEKALEAQTVKDKEFSKNIFNKGGLYPDKPMPEPERELTDAEKFELEWRNEAEYLATLSNFHWFVYPFFKAVEVVCEKTFGCKSRARRENERMWAEREQKASEKQRIREQELKKNN